MSRLDSLMDGSYPELAVLGKIEHLLRGLYHIFQDVSAPNRACCSIVDLVHNRVTAHVPPIS